MPFFKCHFFTNALVVRNFMKTLLFVSVALLVLLSCTKEKHYHRFTGKELDFINYTERQTIKFIDTNTVIHTLEQKVYRRDFHETVSIYGRTGSFLERYEVLYQSLTGNSVGLDISFDKEQRTISVDFCNYKIFTTIDSLDQILPAVTINGTTYTDVYTMKVYKLGSYPGNSDTATLYHNKQSGVIQLLFPNGRRILRTD